MIADQNVLQVLNPAKIFKNIGAQLSGSTFAYAVNAVVSLYIARIIGPAEYGVYTSAIALTFLSSILFNLGLDLWLLKEGGEQPARIQTLTGGVFSLKIILGAIWMILFFFLAEWIDSTIFPKDIVRLGAMTIWLNSLFNTALVPFRALQKNKINSALEGLTSLAWLAVVFSFIRTIELDALAYIKFTLYFALFRTAGAMLVMMLMVGMKFSRQVVNSALQQFLPYATSDFLTWLFTRLDILIIAALLGKVQTGIYAPAVAGINAVFLIPSTILFVIIPTLGKVFVEDPETGWPFFKRIVAFFTAGGIILTVLVFFGADLFILILGDSYAETVRILKLMSIIILSHSVAAGLVSIIVVKNQQSRRAVVMFFVVATNVVMNLVLTPVYGLNGAAASYILAELVLLIGYIRIVRHIRREEQKQPVTRTPGSGT